MKKIALTVLFVMAGCVTSPVSPMLRIGVPMAMALPRAGTVWIRHDSKSIEDGNSYTIKFIKGTNANDASGTFQADLKTNNWPRRVHLDLSIDGGSNWIRRIAYGTQTDRVYGGEYVWAPSMDYTLMTTHARIRVVNLDGSEVGRRGVMPWDMPPGMELMCNEFTIAGIVVEYPAGGAILYNGVNYNLRWRQTGGEGITRICWMTPDTVNQTRNHVMGVCSNTISGTNTFNFKMTCPPSPQAKIVILCDSDPSLIGYSGNIEVD